MREEDDDIEDIDDDLSSWWIHHPTFLSHLFSSTNVSYPFQPSSSTTNQQNQKKMKEEEEEEKKKRNVKSWSVDEMNLQYKYNLRSLYFYHLFLSFHHLSFSSSSL